VSQPDDITSRRVAREKSGERSPRATEILRVAARMFYERDYSSVGMRTIADAAGVRGASLYHHFRSKEEMLYCIVLEVTRDYIDDAVRLLDVEDSHAERIGDLFEGHILYFWEHRHALTVGFRDMHNLTPEHYAEVREHRLAYQRRIQDFIQSGVTAGAFSTAEPRLTALALLDMVNGINDWFRVDHPLTIEQVARQYRHIILATLGAT
jgi:AcrR family transcriptional regulator